jgi:hypothetical protein
MYMSGATPSARRAAPCGALSAAAIGGALAIASCARDPQPVVPQPSPSAPVTYAPWASANVPPPAAPQPRAPMPPAFGFFCRSDQDLQCPYARCVDGRCGGCTQEADCKANGACLASPIGMSCWPRPVGISTAPPPVAPPPPPVAPPPAADPYARARQLCVDRTNEYRARLRLPPLGRDVASEPCADGESQADHAANHPHGTFGRCKEMAQNACPNYPGRTPEDALAMCLQQMFDEGPGGGHYDNMTSPRYARAWCGFHSGREGTYWIVQNFR